MCQFLDLLDFTSEHPGKKVAIMKGKLASLYVIHCSHSNSCVWCSVGLLALMLVYKQRKVDFAYLATKMSAMFATIAKEYAQTRTRDKSHYRHLWGLIVVYLEGTLDIFEHQNKQDLSDSKLLGEF